MKRQHTEWEEIFSNEATKRRLLSKIYIQFIQLYIRKRNKNNNNNNNTKLKNGQKT